jgi:hypothetical protein
LIAEARVRSTLALVLNRLADGHGLKQGHLDPTIKIVRLR